MWYPVTQPSVALELRSIFPTAHDSASPVCFTKLDDRQAPDTLLYVVIPITGEGRSVLIAQAQTPRVISDSLLFPAYPPIRSIGHQLGSHSENIQNLCKSHHLCCYQLGSNPHPLSPGLPYEPPLWSPCFYLCPSPSIPYTAARVNLLEYRPSQVISRF